MACMFITEAVDAQNFREYVIDKNIKYQEIVRRQLILLSILKMYMLEVMMK